MQILVSPHYFAIVWTLIKNIKKLTNRPKQKIDKKEDQNNLIYRLEPAILAQARFGPNLKNHTGLVFGRIRPNDPLSPNGFGPTNWILTNYGLGRRWT